MANLYAVKPSPDKGLGVFATKPIKSGTVIVRDHVIMKIRRPECDVTSQQVQGAFDALSKEDQAAFMALHEGNLPYKTKLLRIYKANAFGDEVHAWVYLKLARLNHSCAPNAEITETDNEADVKVVALKPIQKGEEVLISYNGALEEGSKRERAMVTKENHGFECNCSVCSLTGEEAMLSDGRRRLINAISHKLEGFEPTHLYTTGSVSGLTPGKAWKVVSRYKRALDVPLTPQQTTAYSFILTKLLEAEGMVCYELAKSYATAGLSLLGQLHGFKAAVVLASAQYVTEWMETGLSIMKTVRSPGSKDVTELEEAWKLVRKSGHLRLARSLEQKLIEPKGKNPNKPKKGTNRTPSITERFGGTAFAVEMKAPHRLLSQDECKALLMRQRREICQSA
ncbi:hypothetical protein LTR37_015155 [Vermiconidia calcicola]|uniref:Uncharacterized protein n=1 Tax=Vermiconidia calcicola TaxID=1690605 RepID=A0ACC3MRV4_9PEZI|nr:hypothetical protein LTR37_015155 [Vermiconidia calcicola]